MSIPVAANLYDRLLLLHILAAMVWLGGLVALTVVSALVLRSGDADEVTPRPPSRWATTRTPSSTCRIQRREERLGLARGSSAVSIAAS